jgi:pantoate--beta-alanine ligase
LTLPAPRLIRSESQIEEALAPLRQGQAPLVFVPTMGDLHEGHLTLVRTGAKLGPVLVSIFVNPTQFGPHEDFDSYPRNLERDLELLGELDGVAAVYAPPVEEIYPQGDSTFVEVMGLGEVLEGEFRPGHLRGVTTVLAKLFLSLRPQIAVFGQKDAQQCLVVKRMVQNLRIPVHLLFGPTVRESDGLALSSRNRYLSGEERVQALALHKALRLGEQLLQEGERKAATVESAMSATLEAERVRVDYAALRALPELEAVPRAEGHLLLAVAARVGKARLIDNLCVRVSARGVEEAPLDTESTLEALQGNPDARRSGGR